MHGGWLCTVLAWPRSADEEVDRAGIIAFSQHMSDAITFSVLTRTLSVVVMLSYLMNFFKALSLHPRLSFISETMALAWDSLGPFFFVFFVVYLAFAQMGNLLFGSEMESFIGLSASLVTLFNMLLGDFDWEAMNETSPKFALYYFWAFCELAIRE